MPRIDEHVPGTFCWVELATTNQNSAKKFYSSLFGWDAQDSPIGPDEVYTMFNLNGGVAGAAYNMPPGERSAAPPHWNLYIAVKSADESAKRAAELGGKVVDGAFDVSTHGRMAVIQDPTGAFFCIWESRQHTGTTIGGESGTLCWADLNTPDPERAKKFYEGLFGWNFEVSPRDSSGYIHIKNGADYIGGIPPASMHDATLPPHWMLYFQVADCDASTAKARSLGAREFMAPMSMEEVGRFSIIADPQGAAFSLSAQR
jgi:predicted enzyme related to lactoylglutathione lyase